MASSCSNLLTVPDSPQALGLEHEFWRPYQKESIEQILAAFQYTDRVMVDAPTGAGKTVTGAAIARMLGGNAAYMAHTIYLQLQQLRTLPSAVTVTGRRNHPCINEMGKMLGMTADDADCPCQLACPEEDGGCPYYAQWFRALDSRDVVLNYAFVVRILKARGIKVAEGYGDGPKQNILANPFQGRSLMVCDEGHNLEAALLDADGVEIHQRSFERHGIRLPSSLDVESWFEWAPDALLDVRESYRDRIAGRGTARTREHVQEDSQVRSLVRALDATTELTKSKEHTPIYVGRTEYGYRIRPLWAWNRSHNILFRHAPKTIILSATMGEPVLAAKLLGLENWEHVKVPSTFPVKNRPVFYWPVSRMKYNMSEEDKVKQGVALIHLARKFPDSPGVVHCNSFALGKYLMDVVERYDPDIRSRMFTHTSITREKAFAYFENDPGNEILVTPSATTGVDWDFVGWQMIPKVPFPDLSDEFVRLRCDYIAEDGDTIGKKVYAQEAVKTLVQAAGRCVRTPSSRGVTIVTDSAFWPLFKYTAAAAFPEWFRQAVTWYNPSPA